MIHVKDASQNPLIAAQLANSETRKIFLEQLKKEQEKLRESIQEKILLTPLSNARNHKIKIEWEKYNPVKPLLTGQVQELHFSIKEILPLHQLDILFQCMEIRREIRIYRIHKRM